MTAFASDGRHPRSPATTLASAAIRAAASDWRPLRGKRTRAERDADAGRRMALAFGSLRGIYTKLGHQLATRVDALSDEFRAPLAALGDSAPPVPFERIRAEISRALGSAERFAWIDPEPLGTGSIAQVHRARLRSGAVVAVKVRHAELTPDRIARDVRRLRRIAWVLRPWLGRGDASEIIDGLSDALLREIDFEFEGRVAEAIARDLEDDSRIVVPRVHWEATSRSVLTLDYVPRVRFDDRSALEARGVSLEAVLAIVADAYGRQVFGHGLFHADPHAGNLYVVDEPGPEPRVLFVDFGLAERLSPHTREELRSGLKALLKRDVDGLLAGLERIRALVPGREARAREALVAALDGGAAGALGANAADIRIMKSLGKRLVHESGAFRVPRELLLWVRTLAHVYDLFEQIAPGADPMRRLLPHVLRFVTEDGENATR